MRKYQSNATIYSDMHSVYPEVKSIKHFKHSKKTNSARHATVNTPTHLSLVHIRSSKAQGPISSFEVRSHYLNLIETAEHLTFSIRNITFDTPILVNEALDSINKLANKSPQSVIANFIDTTLVGLTSNPDKTVRDAAFKILTKVTPSVSNASFEFDLIFQSLIERLRDPNEDVRLSAIERSPLFFPYAEGKLQRSEVLFHKLVCSNSSLSLLLKTIKKVCCVRCSSWVALGCHRFG